WGAYREFLYFAWGLSPALASRIGADVREGDGFHRTELRDGRVFAWGGRGAAGRRGGEAVEIAAVSRAGNEEGPETFALTLPLTPGLTELALESNEDERDVGGVRYRKAASLGLFQ